MRGLSTLLVLLAVACGPEEAVEEPQPEETPVARRGHQAGARSPHAQPSGPPPLARVASAEERGRAFEAGAVVRAGNVGISLDLREGARVSVEPGAEVRLLDESPAQVAVARGLVHVVLPPMGSSPRPPLRIGTPSGTLLVNGSGDAWALVFPDGRAWFAVTGGMAQVITPQREEGGATIRTVSIGIHAGQALAAGATEPTPGPENEAAARGAAAALLEGADGEPGADALVDALAELDATCESTREDFARGEALQEAHRVAAAEGEGQDTLQAIVRFSQETQGRRDALLLAYERARALTLRLASAPDPVASRRRDVRAALRLDESD